VGSFVSCLVSLIFKLFRSWSAIWGGGGVCVCGLLADADADADAQFHS